MTILKKAPILIILLAFTAGCGHAVKHTVSSEYHRLKPNSVILLPVVWKGAALEAENKEVSRVFNDMVAEKVGSMGYSIKVVDEEAAAEAGVSTLTPSDIANRFGAQTVLYSSIIEWDTDQLATYAALTMKARFRLYSGNGPELWNAEYQWKRSDLRLDTGPMELAIIDAWEPKVQRFIDIVFTTLPQSVAPAAEQEKYYDWLP